MHYRVLKIGNEEYQYVVGKTHTKVKGVGVIENAKIGFYNWHGMSPCGMKSCGCDSYEYTMTLQVKPSDVAKYIATIASGKEIKLPFNKPPEGFEMGRIYHRDDIFPVKD